LSLPLFSFLHVLSERYMFGVYFVFYRSLSHRSSEVYFVLRFLKKKPNRGTKSKVSSGLLEQSPRSLKREMTEAIRLACIALLFIIYVHTCAGDSVIPLALELIYSPVLQIFFSYRPASIINASCYHS
jgi:hypothetical protein